MGLRPLFARRTNRSLTAMHYCQGHVRRMHADVIHKRWGVITPFRLGCLIGETGVGLDDEVPYTTERSRNAYLEGIEYGKQRRTESERGVRTLNESDALIAAAESGLEWAGVLVRIIAEHESEAANLRQRIGWLETRLRKKNGGGLYRKRAQT